MYLIVWVIGGVMGIVITASYMNFKTGYGYFKIEKIQDEEDLYTVNMRLVPDQELNKKSRIVLKRELNAN